MPQKRWILIAMLASSVVRCSPRRHPASSVAHANEQIRDVDTRWRVRYLLRLIQDVEEECRIRRKQSVLYCRRNKRLTTEFVTGKTLHRSERVRCFEMSSDEESIVEFWRRFRTGR